VYFLLTETTGFTFRFQKTEDIVLANGTLDVTDDGTVGIVHEFNADLGDTTTRTGTAENLSNSSELDRSLRGVLVNGAWLISSLQHEH
jgi:tetrahydromethanopterin S-methyltransferase subunit C